MAFGKGMKRFRTKVLRGKDPKLAGLKQRIMARDKLTAQTPREEALKQRITAHRGAGAGTIMTSREV